MIDLAHLNELSDYYTRLAKLEKEGKKFWKDKKVKKMFEVLNNKKGEAEVFRGFVVVVLFTMSFLLVLVLDFSETEFLKKTNEEIFELQREVVKERFCEGESCNLSEQLFDITFTLEDTVLEDLEKLSAVVTFESFGTVPTPVNLTFIILDSNGNELYREKESIVVEVEEFLRWNYDNLGRLPKGKYIAVLETLYGDNVFDEFKQSFIISKDISFFRKHIYFTIFLFLGILGLIIRYYRNKDYEILFWKR